jgi:hypothetical protein
MDKREKNLRAMNVDMQFLNHHSKQFLDLQAESIKIDNLPQEEADFKTLLLLEIALLFQDFDWSPPAAFKGRLPYSAVLGAAAPAKDDDNSCQEQSTVATPAPAATEGLLQVWI